MKTLKFAVEICYVIILLLSSCEEKCKNYSVYYRMPVVDKYVEVFKDGSIWIYKNQVDSMSDSLKITNYYYKPGEFTDNLCNKWYEKKLVFHSDFLFKKTGEMYYVADETGTFVRFSFGNITFNFRANAQNDSIILSIPNVENGSVFLEDTLKTSIGKVYKDIINVNNQIWFAKGIGIVQYVSILNKNDTLCLTNYKFN
jgi:hypothetical protein